MPKQETRDLRVQTKPTTGTARINIVEILISYHNHLDLTL